MLPLQELQSLDHAGCSVAEKSLFDQLIFKIPLNILNYPLVNIQKTMAFLMGKSTINDYLVN